MSRVVVVGDIHGCLNEFNALLEKVNLTTKDRLVLLGDLVDRGPDSAGVVERVYGLAHVMSVDVVMGNHEAQQLKRDEFSQGHKDFMKTFQPFVRFVVGGQKFLCVHGGLFPAFYDNHELPDNPSDPNLPRKLKDRMSRFRFVRYVKPDGTPAVFGHEKPEDVFWADWYDGRDGMALFGHSPWFGGPKYFDFAIGLDTACVFGGQLTALVLDGKWPNKVVSVQAFDKYAEPLKEDY